MPQDGQVRAPYNLPTFSLAGPSEVQGGIDWHSSEVGLVTVAATLVLAFAQGSTSNPDIFKGSLQARVDAASRGTPAATCSPSSHGVSTSCKSLAGMGGHRHAVARAR